jgi:phosphoglycolate phosphatase-like HAD superfamily hydrolase
MVKTLVLFDIDGTLLDAQGEGRASFYEALNAFFPHRRFPLLNLAGRTDFGAWSELVASESPEASSSFEAFAACYAPLLAARLKRRPPREIPGGKNFFRSVAQQEGWIPCLVTGNLYHGARIKMEAMGLWDVFLAAGGLGTWGDRHATKVGLCEELLSRWRQDQDGDVRAVFLGDTEADVLCAASAGIPCVLVGDRDLDGASARWRDFEDSRANLASLAELAKVLGG